MTTLDDLRRAHQAQMDAKQDVLQSWPALLGRVSDGLVPVAGRDGYVHVRIGSDETAGQARNKKVPNTYDLAVYVGYDGISPEFQVLAIRQEDWVGAGFAPVPEVGPHGATHTWPTEADAAADGSDVTYVAWRQILSLRIGTIAAFTVEVGRGPLFRVGTGLWEWIATQNINLAGDQPVIGARWVLVYLDSAGILQRRLGAIVAPSNALVFSDCPAPLGDEFPLAAVQLYATQTAITETRTVQDVIDLRLQASGGGGVSHDILSATHGDSTPAAVVRGDLMTGQGVVPLWVRLAAGNANEMLKMNAAATDPGWEAFDWDEMAGVGGADMVHDHSSNAEGGQLIDLNGAADALVFDADGDTTISAPVDDEIDIEVGATDRIKITTTEMRGVATSRPNLGTGVAAEDWGHIYQAAGRDVFPDTDGRGLFTRAINRRGIAAYHDHFRSGVIPGGYAWQGAPFGGNPASLNYSAANDYLWGTATGAGVRHFLSTAVANVAAAWQGKKICGRIRTGITTEIGFRLDDGTDNNYAEVYVTGALANATQRLDFRFRAGGGAVNTVPSGLIIPCDTFLTVLLFCYWSGVNYQVLGYVTAEDGPDINVAGFTTGVVVWPPAAGRVGIVIKNAGNVGAVDWFDEDFG